MAKFLIIAEHRDGKLKKSNFELIGAASQAGHDVSVALLTDSAGGMVDELGSYGAKTVFVAEKPEFKFYNPEAYLKGAQEAQKSASADYVMMVHTPTGRDLMPRLAARLGAGLASDCTQVDLSQNPVKCKRPVYAGKALCEVEFLGSGPKLITARANTFSAPKADPSKKATAQALNVDVGSLKTTVKEVVKASLGRPDVTEASIVVSGGRSLKSADGFKILEEMADVIGAAVGASRAAVDSGFRPHRDQVGQTGKVVSPTLYIACGISGAIQHLAGMRTSKTIVAINTDPQAPIFQVADYGIVADLFKVVPLLTQELKKLKEH